MLVGVCSVKGSPGVTTAALAMADRWPVGDPLVIEADPAGGDLAARYRLSVSPGLVSLAAATRRSSSTELLAQHCQRLPGGLRVTPGPVAAEQAQAALTLLSARGLQAVRAAADPLDAAVLVDVGRLNPSSPALPLVRGADALVVLARPRTDELSHVATLLGHIPSWTRTPGLVLVGDGYSRIEVERELRVPVMDTLPHDTSGAAMLGGAERGQAPKKSALGRAAEQLARKLLAHVHPPPLPYPQPLGESPAPTPSDGQEVVPR